MRRCILGICVVLLLVGGGLGVRLGANEAPQADQVPPIEATAMLEAAEQTWQAIQAAWDAGTIGSIDTLYVWSRRWVEAVVDTTAKREQRVAAYLAHRARMKNLHDQTQAKFRVGAKGGEAVNFRATQFYLAEAELWAKRAAGVGNAP